MIALAIVTASCGSAAPAADAGADGSAPDTGPPGDSGSPGDGGAFALTSPAFAAGGKIPSTPYACAAKTYGSGTSPPLAWTTAPGATKSFALLMDDPSAANWTHWVKE